MENQMEGLRNTIRRLESDNQVLGQGRPGYVRDDEYGSLEARLRNENELLSIDNKHLKCDLADKQLLLEELSLKLQRLDQDETRNTYNYTYPSQPPSQLQMEHNRKPSHPLRSRSHSRSRSRSPRVYQQVNYEQQSSRMPQPHYDQ